MRVLTIASGARRFTLVSNEFLRDNSLSWKAKGLLSYLLSHEANHELSLAFILGGARDGRDATLSALSELESAGYLVRHQTRDAQGHFGARLLVLSDDKAALTAEAVSALVEDTDNGKPDNGKSVDGKTHTKKTVLKEEKEKETSSRVHDAREGSATHPLTDDDVYTEQNTERDQKFTSAPLAPLSEADDPSLPKRGARVVLPDGKRYDFEMFKRDWQHATRVQWNSARNGDLLLYILRYWTKDELSTVLSALANKRRAITNPISYLIASLSALSTAEASAPRAKTQTPHSAHHSAPRAPLIAQAESATLDELLDDLAQARLLGTPLMRASLEREIAALKAAQK